MKILYVITGLGMGGAEHVVCNLADMMHSRGHDIQIVYLTGEVVVKPNTKTIPVIPLNLKSLSSLPSVYLKLVKIINNFKPEVIHAHMYHANILARLTIPIISSHVKLITTAHSKKEGGLARSIMYRITHSLSDFSTNVSQEAVREFEKQFAVPEGGMKAVYNGIDMQKFTFNPLARDNLIKSLSLDSSIKIILAVGRLHELKDYPNLLKAINILKKTGAPTFKLLIVGDGPLRPQIENLVLELSLEEDVILMGNRNDIPDMMSAADVFTLSSKTEGFGLVVAEAMSCKCPVVVTDAGGVSEVVGGHGIVVETQNPQQLADGLIKSLNADSTSTELNVESAYDHIASNFDLDQIANQWETVYSNDL